MSDISTATFHGYINTTYDALIVFEACLLGKLRVVPRRSAEDERRKLIQVYRELERPFESGERKRGFKKSGKMGDGAIRKAQPRRVTKNELYSLLGSLVDSYDFKQDSLVKKTISITLWNESYHLVCYYKCEDIKNGLYKTPSQDPKLWSITPRNELLFQEFKVPIFEYAKIDDNHLYDPVQMNYDCSSTVPPQGGIPMDYPPGPMDLHYTYQQPLLVHPQHELLQCRVPSYLPYYSEEQQEAS
ncbi:hypothetical protein CEP51_013487 [Fusarium floridanum]|uniref:Uncharacterized protein n=1 Tax=Fusarium floridanum TaxID=1325733 RepID=A0A428QAU3_9HYPO|nr:hypothetical protein CEP51_013487 [Fusarium floridanum]